MTPDRVMYLAGHQGRHQSKVKGAVSLQLDRELRELMAIADDPASIDSILEAADRTQTGGAYGRLEQ